MDRLQRWSRHNLTKLKSKPRKPRKYVYEPFNANDQIRLLSFVGNDPSTFACSLSRFRLEDAPPYHALSYCWGDGAERVPLSCDGGYIDISVALHRALPQVRTHLGNESVSYIWVDQLCINQADTNERTAQVLLMRSIYTKSKQTLIWLDEADAGKVARVFDLLKRAYEARTTASRTPNPDGWQGFGVITQTENDSLGLPDLGSPLWAELGDFVGNAFFSRVWVVQEAALSKLSPLMLCQNQTLDYNIFARAVIWLRSRRYSGRTAFSMTSSGPELIAAIRHFRREDSGTLPLWSLESLLLVIKHVHATDCRDRIYALLGLVSVDRSVTHVGGALFPDYSRDPFELFAAVAQYCIRESQRLYLLGVVHVDLLEARKALSSTAVVPSWLPRWDLPTRTAEWRHKIPSTDYRARRTSDPLITTFDAKPFAAACRRPVQLKDVGNHRELVLKGIYLSTISWVAPLKGADPTKREPLRRVWEHCVESLNITVDPENERFKQFAIDFYTAITYGVEVVEGSWDSPPPMVFWAHLADCYWTKNPVDQAKHPHAIYRQLAGDVDGASVIFWPIAHRLFLTTDGRIGMGAAPLLQPGDQVFVLFGGNTPYVLREQDNGQFRYIGEAYVNSAMRGEIVAECEEGKREDRWVTLV